MKISNLFKLSFAGALFPLASFAGVQSQSEQVDLLVCNFALNSDGVQKMSVITGEKKQIEVNRKLWGPKVTLELVKGNKVRIETTYYMRSGEYLSTYTDFPASQNFGHTVSLFDGRGGGMLGIVSIGCGPR